MTAAEALEATQGSQQLTAQESSALSASTIVARTLEEIRSRASKEGRRNISVGFTDSPIWDGWPPCLGLPAQSEEQLQAWASEIESLGYIVKKDEQLSARRDNQTVYRITW